MTMKNFNRTPQQIYVDFLLIWGWGGWWYRYGWGWWAWWVIYCECYKLLSDCYCAIIWAWGWAVYWWSSGGWWWSWWGCTYKWYNASYYWWWWGGGWGWSACAYHCWWNWYSWALIVRYPETCWYDITWWTKSISGWYVRHIFTSDWDLTVN